LTSLDVRLPPLLLLLLMTAGRRVPSFNLTTSSSDIEENWW